MNMTDLSPDQVEELKKLGQFQIDYSDIPQRTDFSGAIFRNKEEKQIGECSAIMESRRMPWEESLQ